MRTGANFARGSCRALKWMLVLGALSVMGSAQAVAQPTMERVDYTGNTVTVTLSEPSFLTLGSSVEGQLATDFALSGGNTGADAAIHADAVQPISAGGLTMNRFPGGVTITLRFAENISTLMAATATVPAPVPALMLHYTQATSPDDATRRIVESDGTMPMETGVARLVAPTTPTDLTLEILPAVTTALSRLKAGTAIASPGIALGTATGAGVTATSVTYGIVGTLPTGVTIAVDPTQDRVVVTDPVVLTGTPPSIIATYNLVYTATIGTDDDAPTARAPFTIKVGDVPDAVDAAPTVVAASPSSLTVTWKTPESNNSPILQYHVQYRVYSATATNPWRVAIAPAGIAATQSYTIEGLAPGEYQVRVQARNHHGVPAGEAGWGPAGRGKTGGGPVPLTLAVTVDPTLPEGRDGIPVKVTGTVPTALAAERRIAVTLTLTKDSKPEDTAELPNLARLPFDLTWASPVATKPATTVLTLVFASNLSSEATTMLATSTDEDAEDEAFSIAAASKADELGVVGAGKGSAKSKILDAQEQTYTLQLPVALESTPEIKEGNGDVPVTMSLIVEPYRTLPKSFFVSLESEQGASAYSLTSGGTSSGGPTAVSLRIDMEAGESKRDDITLTAASNDGDRVDDNIVLQLFETSAANPTTAGTKVGEAVMLKVVDQHRLPTVTLGPIMVDGAAVESLMEGQTGTVTLTADRGTATDATPDDEAVTVTLTHGAASSASAADYSLSSETVTIAAGAGKQTGTFMLEVLADDVIDAEELVLQAAVTGVATNGEAADMVDFGPISFTDGTTKLVYPKTDEEIQAVIYPAKEAGMGDDMMFNPGEMIEIASPGSLFNNAEGVTLSFTAMSDMEDVATVAVSGGMVTVTAQDMAGVEAKITITAHASMAAAGAKGLPQTDPSEASIVFPVDVGLEALSFMLSGPEDMNLAEGMSAMVTAMANRAVTEEVTVTLMRDRSTSTAGDDDYTADPITIAAGEMMGTTMVMATADDMAEEMEELVLYGMAADNAGEVTGEVKLYLWDTAVPALPLIAQLLLGLLLGIGGYRRYLRR